jgi:hypothetical protein
MATIKGFTIIFVSGTRIRQVTMATTDERFIERQLECPRSCPAHPLDAKALGLLNLKHGDWLERAPIAAHASCIKSIRRSFPCEGQHRR